VNFVKGTNRAMRRGAKGSHAAVNTLRGQKVRVTAPNLAQLGVVQELPQCQVDLSRLDTELKEYSPWPQNFRICEYGCAVPRTHFPGRDGHETWPRPQGCLKGQFWAPG